MTHFARIKTFSLTVALIMTGIFTTLQSSTCSKNDDVVTINTGSIEGSWKITLFWDEKDETSSFTTYTFTFNSNGEVIATNGIVTSTGKWSETGEKLILDFGTDPILSELNDDWQKEEKTSTSIKLKDDNPAQDDKLQFTKN